MFVIQRLARVTGQRCALAAIVAGTLLSGCGGAAPTPYRSVMGGVVPPLADVKWVPQYPLGDEPSVFNEPPLRGKVVVLDFYASW
jgi:hypothetical protein